MLALLAVCAAVLVSLVPASAAPVYSYFPTASTTDGKMLRIAGVDLQTLAGQTVTVSFSADKSTSTFNVGFFDGASNTAWDQSTVAFPTSYTLYADPLGDGTGTTVVATWLSTAMAANAWSDFPVATSAAAKSPSGNYFYRLVAAGTSPGVSAGNCFKVRVEGYTFIAPTAVFGFTGAYNQAVIYPSYPTRTPTTYDGVWDFYLYAPQDMTRMDIWDGDFDVAVDTDDPNTDTSIPSFDAGAGEAEGANDGQPPDDNTNANYLRTPSVRYEVTTPSGATFTNTNPSGNTEWELYRLDTTTSNPAVTDSQPTSLPAGMYRVRLSGLDLHNTDALRFDAPLIGVDGTGRPMIPPAPFLVGDTIWNDVNGDGVKQAGENGIADVVVTLRDRVTGSVLAAATSDASGVYSINTWGGTFDVVVDGANFSAGGPLEGFVATVPTPASKRVTVTTLNLSDADFGFRTPPLPPGVIVTPDQSGSITPSSTIDYSFSVRNNTGVAGVFDLSSTTTMGWTRLLRTVTGSTITSVSLASGETTTVVVRISVPSTATVGMQDVTRLTAQLRTNAAVTDSAAAVTTVMSGLTIVADQSGYASPSTTTTYTHTITNSWPTTRTVTLTAANSLGWTTQFFAADGVTQITTVSVGPFGASANVYARVTVPTGATVGQNNVTTVTAIASTGTGTQNDTAVDTTTVRQLNTYDSNLYTNAEDTFPRGDTVYARATGLTAGWNVYFKWIDSTGTNEVRTSPTIAVNAQGAAFDQYATVANDPTGNWTVEVWRDRGNDTRIEITPFKVTADAKISRVSATDAPGSNTTVAVTSVALNQAVAPILNSTMTYIMWWDENGDGVFGNGDTYIDSLGQPRTWNGVTAVSTHVTSGIDVAGNSAWTQPPWTVSNTAFPHQGNYNVTATWNQFDGTPIDVKTGQFFSIPALGWPLFAVLLAFAAGLAWLRLRREGPLWA